MIQSRPMCIAVSGGKGGTGKTTVAVNVAAEFLRRGLATVLIDADPQGTGLRWAKTAAAAKRGDIPVVVPMGTGLRSLVPDVAREKMVVIDGPPRHDAIQRAMLLVADVVLLPCVASMLDAWALEDSVKLVRAAQERDPLLQAAIVLVRTEPRANLTTEVRAYLRTRAIPLLQAELGRRVAFSEAFGCGQGVVDYEPDGQAAAEVRALVDQVLALRSGPARAHRRTG